MEKMLYTYFWKRMPVVLRAGTSANHYKWSALHRYLCSAARGCWRVDPLDKSLKKDGSFILKTHSPVRIAASVRSRFVTRIITAENSTTDPHRLFSFDPRTDTNRGAVTPRSTGGPPELRPQPLRIQGRGDTTRSRLGCNSSQPNSVLENQRDSWIQDCKHHSLSKRGLHSTLQSSRCQK